MSDLPGEKRSTYVQSMFARIAGRYDLLNRLITMGQDVRWRKEVIRKVRLTSSSRLLDIGTGTGDLVREALAQNPGAGVVGADFTLEMMRVGQKKGRLNFAAADALHLPFQTSTFDGVVSGFLMRNVIDITLALEEQYRVLEKGGRVVILDTTRPQKNIFSPLIWIQLHIIIPTLGRIFTKFGEAYHYLPETTEDFVTAEELAERMSSAGFVRVGFRRLMFGTIAIHWGEK
ncbi:MAG: ubiquinone/menaquinone biosynthesis methyltransferase [Anaerolineales bacterium]|nr:ubiquinone/menaquinone biosynthesis methyltransferase [Anaerolineales bacterium]